MIVVRTCIALLLSMGASWLNNGAAAAADYHPIALTMTGETVTVTGRDLTIDQIVQVARYGAEVQLSPAARQRQEDTAALLTEGAAEGIAIYLFNRNAGFLRETPRFGSNSASSENRLKREQSVQASFRNGANAGDGPELVDEDVVRAVMLVYLSEMTWRPASPQLTQMMVDLLNNDITPVVNSRGGTGQAQGPATPNIRAATVGSGEVYYHGQRMPAAEALQKAGLKPIQPAPSDSALGATNADVAGMAALLVADAKKLLDWVDLVYAIDLNGMNSSITPLFGLVQANRPFKWINWDAARVLDMLKGSYLFDGDPKRIIQDPESLRAGYVRQGSAWEEWANLRDDVTIQINYSDGNPATKPNTSPKDSWELSTGQAMQFYVKGSAANGYKHGFIFSNANWDPYPLSNRLESFTIALANMDVAVMLRQERFESTFFTVVQAHKVLKTEDDKGGIPPIFNSNHEVWQRIQGLMNPVPPEGYSSDPEYDQDLDAETLFKTERAVQAVEESWKLVASDLVTGARWMDVRKAQDLDRNFGAAPTAALTAFRKVLPLQPRLRETPRPRPTEIAAQFIKMTPASTFYPAGPAMPAK